MHACRIATVAAALLGAVSCTEPATPEPEIGLKFVAGGNVTDTARAWHTQALVVEVHDKLGALAAPGTAVRFASAIRDGEPEVFVTEPAAFSENAELALTVDAAGQTKVLIRMGNRAGTGRLIVSVPTLGLIDTVENTILPGAPVALDVSPAADTAMMEGRTVAFSAHVFDQYGNERTDPITWSGSSGVTVSQSGSVTSNVTGTYDVTATAAVGTVTRKLTVVPVLRITGTSLVGGRIKNIVTMNIDGSDLRIVAQAEDGGIGVDPVFVPGGDNVIYSTYNGIIQTLRTATPDASDFAYIDPLPNVITHQADPRPTASGNFMFFIAWNDECTNKTFYSLGRSALNGANPDVVWCSDDQFGNIESPSPSPDGSKVVFNRKDATAGLYILEVATQDMTHAAATAETGAKFPAWAPSGAEIVTVTAVGTLRFLTPAGAFIRDFPQAGYSIEKLSWSSNSRWVLARHTSGPQLLEATTGKVIPLPWLTAYRELTIK
jgi:hypothetical protein